MVLIVKENNLVSIHFIIVVVVVYEGGAEHVQHRQPHMTAKHLEPQILSILY